MEWFILAMVAAILWAGTNVIDKHIITNLVKSPAICITISLIIGIFSTSLILIPFGISFALWPALAGLVIGLLWLLWYFTYYTAIKHEEASRVSAFYQTTPLFTLFLAVLLLGEGMILSLYNYIGIFLIVAGAALLLFKRGGFHLRIIPLIFFGVLLLGVQNILVKIFVRDISYLDLVFWHRIWIGAIALAILLPLYIKDIKINKGSVGFFITSSVVSVIGSVGFILAATTGPISLISAVVGAQPLFILLFAVTIGHFFGKHLLLEDLDKKAVGMKILFSCFILLGLFLIGL